MGIPNRNCYLQFLMQKGNGYRLVIPANDNQNRKPIMFGISWIYHEM